MREKETALLCAILGKPSIIDTLALSAGLFQQPDCRAVFEAIEQVRGRGVAVDGISLTDALRSSGRSDLILDAAALSPTSSANASYYAEALREAARKKGIRLALASGLEAIADESRPAREVLDEVERGLLGAVRGVPETEDARASALLGSYFHELEERGRALAEGRSEAIDTGLRPLDSILGPIRPGEVVVVAARPGAGKTAFALQVAAHVAAELRQPAAIFSLEMSRAEVLDRLLAGRASYPLARLRSGGLKDGDFGALLDTGRDFAEAPLSLFDGPHGLSLLKSRIRREKTTHGLKLAVVDYLGLLDLGGGNAARWEKVSEATRALKLAALDLSIVVLLCSQLNREGADKEPMLSHLRESGSVEQDADRVILLHRPNPGEEEVVAIVAKNRHGALGACRSLDAGGERASLEQKIGED